QRRDSRPGSRRRRAQPSAAHFDDKPRDDCGHDACGDWNRRCRQANGPAWLRGDWRACGGNDRDIVCAACHLRSRAKEQSSPRRIAGANEYGRKRRHRMNLPQFALRRPFTVIVIVIAVALVSVLSWQRMPKDIFPTLGIPTIYIAQPYGG